MMIDTANLIGTLWVSRRSGETAKVVALAPNQRVVLVREGPHRRRSRSTLNHLAQAYLRQEEA